MPSEGMPNDEIRELLKGLKVPVKVSMLSPLDVYINTEVLRAVVRKSLKGLEEHRDQLEEFKALEYAIQQRIDFLAWLQTVKDDEIMISLYPAEVPGDERIDELFDQLKDL